MNRRFYIVFALMLAVAALLSSCANVNSSDSGQTVQGTSDSVETQQQISLRYDFADDVPGSAEGRITLSCQTDSEVSVCWAKGGVPLENYGDIFSGKPDKNGIISHAVRHFTAIPAGADSVSFSTGNYSGVYYLPQQKRFDESPLYSFGVLSDVHMGTLFDNTSEIPVNCLNNALNALYKEGAEFVGISGDIGTDGKKFEYQLYYDKVSDFTVGSGIPVFAVKGNHDCQNDTADYWIKYTDIAAENSEYVRSYAANGVDYTASAGKDCCVYLNQTMWDYGKTSSRIITDEQLDWLQSVFETHQSGRIFMFFHTFLNDTCGEVSNGTVEYTLYFTPGAKDELRLRELLKKYKNVIWFSGHSHFSFEMQELPDAAGSGRINSNLNIFDGGGEYAALVHVPSVTNPREIDKYSISFNNMFGRRSQGYVVRVYENAVMLCGYDFIDGSYICLAQYII